MSIVDIASRGARLPHLFYISKFRITYINMSTKICTPSNYIFAVIAEQNSKPLSPLDV